MRHEYIIPAAENNGFIAVMSPDAARRQLRVSIAVAGAFIAATLLVLVTGSIKPRIEHPATVKLTIQLPGTISMHHAANTTQLKRGI